MQRPSVEEFSDWISALAKKDSLEFDLHGNKTESTSILFQKEELKNCSQSSASHLNLRLLKGEKAGVSYTKNFSKEGLKSCYQQALDSLRLSDKKERGFFGQNQRIQDFSGFYSEKLAKTPLQQKIQSAEEMNQACLKSDKKIQPVYSSVEDRESFTFHASSANKSLVFFTANGVHASCYSLAVDGQKRANGDCERSQADYSQINFSELGREAGKKAIGKLNWSLPETKKYPVVFQAGQSVSTLLGWLSSALSGKLLFDKMSLFKDDLGENIFSQNFSLYDEPFAPWGFRSFPFDGEGFAAEKTPLVEKGRLSNYLTSSFFAKALNLPHNKKARWDEGGNLYPSPSNLLMPEGESSFEELKTEFPQTILLDNLKGLAGYNATSGDFSIESEGFLCVNGEKRPICGFTVSGNIKKLFSNILKIGQDSRIHQGTVKAPSFLTAELMVAGK